MDEASPFESDEMVSSSLIDGVLDEAISNTLLKSPVHRLTPTNYPASITKNSDGSGTLSLPDNYLRFISLLMNGWEVPATKAMNINDPEYPLQKNTWLRGGVSKPKVAIIQNVTNPVLEYYSLPTTTETHEITHLYIITRCEANEIPDVLIPLVTWEAASLAFGVVNDLNSQQYASLKANEQLNLLSQ